MEHRHVVLHVSTRKTQGIMSGELGNEDMS